MADYDAQIGQWYVRRDTAERFVVTGCDDASGTVEIQRADGDLDELDEESWSTLPIVPADPPQDWREPLDEADDPSELGDSASELRGGEATSDAHEAWEDVTPREEFDLLNERTVTEEVAPEEDEGASDDEMVREDEADDLGSS